MVVPVSWGSSSKSRGRAVVGDSGLGLVDVAVANGLLGVDCAVSILKNRHMRESDRRSYLLRTWSRE